jgi:2-methylcitrate dehydratase PrpD
MTLALELARRSGAITFDSLPTEAVAAAKAGILDTVGVTLAGSSEATTRIVAKQLARGGPSLLFGTDDRMAPLDAALANGTASHALDFDDMANHLGGHPSVPILPALFALADAEPVAGHTIDGRAFIAAYVAGFETECKIGRGVNFHHYTKGWHPTATLGVLGAAAACSHLLRLDADRTAIALAIATSFASGIKANFGTMTKPLHVGHCTRNGLFAALLARDGFTANQGAFEHKQGFLALFNGAGTYDVARMLDSWGAPFEIVNPGIAAKQYPCCGSTHPALDVMLDLVRRHDLQPNAVARIESWTHTRRLEHTNRPDPQSALDAKFSVQHCLALALVDRAIKIEHFEGGAWRDPRVRAILPRVQTAPYTTDQFAADNHFGAEIKLTLTDGQVIAGKTEQPLGRALETPLPAERLREKFDNCVARVLPHAASAPIADLIARLDQVADMRTLSALLAPAPETKRRASA